VDERKLAWGKQPVVSNDKRPTPRLRDKCCSGRNDVTSVGRGSEFALTFSLENILFSMEKVIIKQLIDKRRYVNYTS
jgi:hypothetical protein